MKSRTRLFDPRGAPGALPVGQYTGERVTVVAKGDGQLEAFRDRFDGSEDGPRELHDSSEWIGWTWFEMVGHGWKWLGMVGNGWTWLDMVGNGWKWLEMVGHGWAWLEIVGNGLKWLEMV